MTDIISSMPEYCDDCDPPTWHLYHYWIHDDGSYTVCDTDGNHDPVDKEDLPSGEEEVKAWQCYARWVVEHGVDPIGNFMVMDTIKTTERWWFLVNTSIAGVSLIAAKRGRTQFTHRELPEHVRQYLNMTKDGRLDDFKDWAAFHEILPDVKPLRWFSAEIEHNKPRNPDTITRELRKIARRAA